jgi:hypothetical protein
MTRTKMGKSLVVSLELLLEEGVVEPLHHKSLGNSS